jgi:hypothetical protein
MVFFSLLLLLVLVTGVLVVRAYLGQRRSTAVEAIAPQTGLTFLGNGNHLIPDVVWEFGLFSKGRSRTIGNVLQGQIDDNELFIFDYQYTTGSRKNSHTHTFTVALIWLRGIQLPAFSLIPKNFFHRIGCMFGYQDINFDGYPQFSELYLLRGSDEYGIRSLFNHWLLSFYARNPATCSEGMGKALLYYHTDGKLNPTNWPNLLAEAQEVAELLSKAAKG